MTAPADRSRTVRVWRAESEAPGSVAVSVERKPGVVILTLHRHALEFTQSWSVSFLDPDGEAFIRSLAGLVVENEAHTSDEAHMLARLLVDAVLGMETVSTPDELRGTFFRVLAGYWGLR